MRMGWQNPEIPWRELERRLSGRALPPDQPAAGERLPFPGMQKKGDGGDSPAWSRKREAYEAPALERTSPQVPFAELHAHSSFSFLDGASSPEELVEEAVRLGLESLTLTDHDGVYGLVRFSEAAENLGLPTGFGAELSLDVPLPPTRSERAMSARVGVPDPPGQHLLVLARDPEGYARLSRTIGRAHLRGGNKGHPVYDDDLESLGAEADGHWLVLTGCRKGSVRRALDRPRSDGGGEAGARRALDELVSTFGRDNVVVELTHEFDPLADERYEVLAALAQEFGLPLVATTAAHYHGPPRRPLATAMAAVRARSSLDDVDGWLPSWSGQHLRSGDEMAQRFARWPDAVTNATRLGTEISFSLQLIAPDLPPFPCPDGLDEMGYLRRLTDEGFRTWFAGTPHADEARDMIEHELEIIEELHFPGYFLVVWDIARFCRAQGILCQGRGSAANSAVCFALGITAVDPVYYGLMFERFLAPERGEPPDIDLDIESDRREEAIQYVYELHGREHAAQVANVITYRPKSAVRDVAKALGYSAGQQDAWSKEIEQGYYWAHTTDNGTLPPTTQTTEQQLADVPPAVVQLAAELQDTPRHLGIHSGGMVMCDRPVIEVCPVEWGRMPNRTVLQWDKDDCAQIGLVKFDLLGLGMLSAIQYCFALIAKHHGVTYELATIPKESPCVYEMLQRADSVGVFQVESRAQMATLPRLEAGQVLRPRLRGGAHPARPHPGRFGPPLHPAQERRGGGHLPAPEAEAGPRADVRHPAVPGAADADRGRRRRLQPGRGRPAAPGHGVQSAARARSRRCASVSTTAWPATASPVRSPTRSTSASRPSPPSASPSRTRSRSLLLVYASSWLKLHHPAAFCAALLNAQPMGFYSPQSLVHDAKRHGVEVRGPSLSRSLAGASLEDDVLTASQCPCLDAPQPAVRLGLASVRTIGTDIAELIVAAREADGPFTSMADLARRVGLSADQVEALATSGAFDAFGTTRREALWGAGAAATARPGQLDLAVFDETPPAALPAMTAPEQLIADMWSTHVTPEIYPTALIRPGSTPWASSRPPGCGRCPTGRASRSAASSPTGSARPPRAGSRSSTSRTRRAWST